MSGAIPNISFTSGISTQYDAQHPVPVNPPPTPQNNQLVQQIDTQINEVMSTMPPEIQQMISSINPSTFHEAQRLLNQFIDEEINNTQQQPVVSAPAPAPAPPPQPFVSQEPKLDGTSKSWLNSWNFNPGLI